MTTIHLDVVNGQIKRRTRDQGPKVSAAHLLVVSVSGAILLLRRVGADYGGHWGMPGGGIDPGEDSKQAIIRECFEEMGADLTKSPVAMSSLYPMGASGGSMAYCLPNCSTFEPVLNDEHDSHVWAYPDQLPSPMHPNALAIINQYQKARS